MQFASDMIGDTTAYVYGVLLKLLTKDLPRCRFDPVMDTFEDDDDAEKLGFGAVTTDTILDNLKTSVDLSLGIGKAQKGQVSSRAAEEVHQFAPKKKVLIAEAEVDGEASADEDEDDESSEEEEYNSNQPANFM